VRVLVACESSGRVREAFRRRGHDAWSCDLLWPEDRSPYHYTGSILDHEVIKQGWDLLIAHPDCTFLTVSANRWAMEEWRIEARLSALHFVRSLWAFPVKRKAIENPIGVLNTFWREPDQTIQPWQFGQKATKATCLWLDGLPPLQPTDVVGPPPANMTLQEKRGSRPRPLENPQPDVRGDRRSDGRAMGRRRLRGRRSMSAGAPIVGKDYRPHCGCDVLPWDDCSHTGDYDEVKQ
jgi:hypothetical protein